MKYLFLAGFGVLMAASVFTRQINREEVGEHPVLYWVTDKNPARQEQVRLFHRWLDAEGYPPVELRLDVGNSDTNKIIIQGVSGVGSDLIDVGSWNLRYFYEIGLLEDVTDSADAMGFGLDQTYPALAPDITIEAVEGQPRQYVFPCNVTADGYWVNREAFARHGLTPPAQRWTLETFERLGSQFVERANQGQYRRVFFIDKFPAEVLRRSFGVDRFNETLTACALDDPGHVQALQKLHQWTYVDHLLPSSAERASFTTEGGYGGQAMPMFIAGQYALMYGGRYGVIEFRRFDKIRAELGQPRLDLGVCEVPHAGFPNTQIMTRAAAVYAGGQHKELARMFLAYLASEAYNLQIVRDGDGLPPNPRYTQSEAYLRPPGHENEWGTHEVWADLAAEGYAVVMPHSPFVLTSVATREDDMARDAFMNGLLSAEQAAAQAARRINVEIQRTLAENPPLQARYDHLTALQQRIDERKVRLRQLEAAGQPVPEELKIPEAWLKNPFHRAYYQFKGWSRP